MAKHRLLRPRLTVFVALLTNLLFTIFCPQLWLGWLPFSEWHSTFYGISTLLTLIGFVWLAICGVSADVQKTWDRISEYEKLARSTPIHDLPALRADFIHWVRGNAIHRGSMSEACHRVLAFIDGRIAEAAL